MAQKNALKVPAYVREHLEDLLPVLERISSDINEYQDKLLPLPEAIVEQLNTTIAEEFQNLANYPDTSRDIKEALERLNGDFLSFSDPFEYASVKKSIKEAIDIINRILEME